MRVWVLQTGEPLPVDPEARLLRTGRLARALEAAGHEVLWWASTFDHERKRPWPWPAGLRRIGPGLDVHLLAGPAYGTNISLRRYFGDISIARSFHAEVQRREARGAPRPDVILASMPSYFLASEAVTYARGARIPVVVDVRDAWPDIFPEALPRWSAPMARLALIPDRRRVAALLRGSTSITSVMESLLTWALRRAGRTRTDRDRVFPLGADPLVPADPHKVSPGVREIVNEIQGRFVVTYVGMFGRFTDPGVIVSAARRLNASPSGAERFSFVLVGDGPGLSELRRSALDLHNVHFTGYLTGNDLSAVLSVGSVGVVACPRGYDAMPNKFFTYLAAGLPVVASPAGEMCKVLQRDGVGAGFEAQDPASLARVLQGLGRDRDELTRMAVAARASFSARFQSSAITGQMVRHLEGVAESTLSTSPTASPGKRRR